MAAEETLIIKPKVKIKVFCVGGGGNSVLMRMGRHKDLDIDLIAINTDANAPIFDSAHYGIVGNAMTNLPALTEAFKAHLAQAKKAG